MWTPVLDAARLKQRPVPLMIAGEKLVFFRSSTGPAALLDRCPHRGVALSQGAVREGCLECPFHGWRFDAEGAARFVPWNPEARTTPLGTISFPVAEAGGVIWLYTAPQASPPPLPPVAQALAARPRSAVTERVIQTHWTRLVENVLDAPHLPFVHRWTLGVAARAPAEAGASMETTFIASDGGGVVRWSVDGATTGPNQGWVHHFSPNMMALGLQPGWSGPPAQLVAAVPIDETRTRSLLILAPDLSLFRVLDFVFGQRLAWEDQHVIETHEPAEVPRPGTEVSVRSDRATLAFRRYYDSVLRDSSAELAASHEAQP